MSTTDKAAKCKMIVKMEDKVTTITNPLNGQAKTFAFDDSMWSSVVDDAHYRSQDYVYSTIGDMVMNYAFSGYNTCLFAYGQTGSGWFTATD